jgi:alanine racemase
VTRPTRVLLDHTALIHNVKQIRAYAPGKKIIAMVKANAYGCGLSEVIPQIDSYVDAFGVASLQEALAVRSLGSRNDCILFQGVFSLDEFNYVAKENLQCVIHQEQQLRWLLHTPLSKKIKIWLKVNTGMHRLGFEPDKINDVIAALRECSWVDNEIGLMSHFACADEQDHPANKQQLDIFNNINCSKDSIVRSIANSAAIISFPESHADVIRPGIMLYGVSPFAGKSGIELGLLPVMQLISAVSAIHHYPPNSPVGYGGTWQSNKPAIIGVLPVGYGDGYPRHITNAHVWIRGMLVPVVGRISMDMLTVDLTSCPDVVAGEQVELWGKNLAVEDVAKKAGTIAYELLCQMAPRVRI